MYMEICWLFLKIASTSSLVYTVAALLYVWEALPEKYLVPVGGVSMLVTGVCVVVSTLALIWS